MKNTTFRWYIKKSLFTLTSGKTLKQSDLQKIAQVDPRAKALLELYRQSEHYYENGFPDRNSLQEMPEPHRLLYYEYHRYLFQKKRKARIKSIYRKRLTHLMLTSNLSCRTIGRICDVDFTCISRFLRGTDSAIGIDRLSDILRQLQNKEMIPLSSNHLSIEDYAESKLAQGLLEISFTVSASEPTLNSLLSRVSLHDILECALLEQFQEKPVSSSKNKPKEIPAHEIPHHPKS